MRSGYGEVVSEKADGRPQVYLNHLTHSLPPDPRFQIHTALSLFRLFFCSSHLNPETSQLSILPSQDCLACTILLDCLTALTATARSLRRV